LFLGRFEIHRNHITLNELRYLGADHVRAEQLTGFLVEDNLHQALIFAQRYGLAVADEGKAANPYVEPFLFGRLFGEADRSDLRRAVCAAGNQRLVHWMRIESLDRLNADNALVLGLVGQHRRPRNVAYCIDAGDIGLAELVNHDDAAIGFHAQFFETEILDITDNANCRDDPLNSEGLRFAALLNCRCNAVGFFVEFGHFRIRVDPDALLLKTLSRKALDLVIFNGQNLWQDLDYGHV